MTEMKAILIVGILLIALGVISLAFQGITYKTDKEVINVGPIQASAETTKRIPLPPALGAMALVGGAILTGAGLKKKLKKSKES